MKFILGKKIAMSQFFDEKGNHIPVTLIEADPCLVLQVKSKDKDGYESVQLGTDKLKDKKVTKSIKTKPFRFIKEFRGNIDISKYKVGDEVDVSVFEEQDKVKISGISKGKGFAGVVKKWGFHGRPASHGTKHELRAPGSIGSSTPQRVVKGKKMPGRGGNQRKTIQNRVIKIEKENNLIIVEGCVPGRKGTFLEIRG